VYGVLEGEAGDAGEVGAGDVADGGKEEGVEELMGGM
jgi:hypothetical protein